MKALQRIIVKQAPTGMDLGADRPAPKCLTFAFLAMDLLPLLTIDA